MMRSRKANQWLLPIAILVVWQLAAATHKGLDVLPTTEISRASLGALRDGRLPADALHTFAAAMASWVICLLI
jgi:NitT/TauT family transport system permease protein